MRNIFSIKITEYLFQLAIAIVFGYFGFQAILNPELEAAKWVSPIFSSILETIIPLSFFMFTLGATQIVVAFLLIINKLTNHALLLATIMLIGIIVNLGWNELALRDFTILAGVLFLYSYKLQLHKENTDSI